MSTPTVFSQEISLSADTQSTANAPIGVFDSGVGGISVLRALVKALPHERFVYIADSAYAPYGERSAPEVVERSHRIMQQLFTHQVKAVVIACNTATVLAVDSLRAHVNIPIVAIEPAIKPAVLASKSGVVGVLATSHTIASPSVARLCALWGQQANILLQACPGLVEQVEAGHIDSAHTQQLIRGYLTPMLVQGVDTVVLGCTHYPFLQDIMQNIAGDTVRFIDPAQAVAKELQRRLAQHLAPAQPVQSISQCDFYTTGDAAQAQHVISSLWGDTVSVQCVSLN